MATLELTRDEIVAAIEKVAQERRGVSASRLVTDHRAARLDNPGEVGDALVLADLLDEPHAPPQRGSATG